MKYILEMEQYLIVEAETLDKIDKNKIRNFFKNNWKILLTTFGISLSALLAYFLFKKSPVPHANSNVSKQGSNDINNKIDTLLNILPTKVKQELKSNEYNNATKSAIVDTLVDIINPLTKQEIIEDGPQILIDIINTSDNKIDIINNMVTAYEQGSLKWRDIPKELLTDFKKLQDSRKPVLTDEMWNSRLAEMSKLGINYNETDLPSSLFKIEKSMLESPYEETYQNTLKKILNIKKIRGNFWNSKQFSKANRESAIKEKGFTKEDFDTRTYEWLTNPNKSIRTDFWDHLSNKKNKFEVQKEKEWIEKIKIIKNNGFDVDDFDISQITAIKTFDIPTFKKYIKKEKLCLQKGIFQAGDKDFTQWNDEDLNY